MTTPITQTALEQMTNPIAMCCTSLLSVRHQLLSYPRTPQRLQSIGRLTKAWEEASIALRSLGYLVIDEQEVNSGQEKTLESSND